jgi:hypothetical protein
MAGVSLNGQDEILASRLERVTVWTRDPNHDESATSLPLTIRIPRKTKRVRVLMETERGGRIGAADVDRKTIDAAPAAATPDPGLNLKRPDYVRPSMP